MATRPTPLPQSTAPINKRAATVLTYGFRVSATLLALGIALALLRDNSLPNQATDLRDIIPGLLDGDEVAIVTLSIVAMVATPVVSVLVVALGFLRIGDRRYAKLSLAVLTVLIISIIAAFVRQ